MKKIFFLLLITIPAFSQETSFHKSVVAALDTGNFIIAHEELSEHLYRHPSDIHSYKLRSKAREGLNQYEEAITDLNIFLDHAPDDLEGLFDRAVLRYKTKRYHQAIEDFKVLLNKKIFQSTTTIYFQQTPNSNSPVKAFTVQGDVEAINYYYIGLSYFHLDQIQKAISYYDSALLYEPSQSDFLIARGLAYDKSGNYNLAIADYKTILSSDPTHGLAKYNLGNLLNRIGKTEEAYDYMTETAEELPELAYPHAELALQYFNRGNYKDALKLYNKALNINERNIDYLINRGKVKIQLEDYEGASGDFMKVLEIQPDNEQAYFNMAVAEYKNGQTENAIKLLDLAIYYYPEYANAYFNRAVAYYDLKDLPRACHDISEAQKLGMKVSQKMMITLCN